MKKKLLILAVMIIAIMSIFAVTASAVTGSTSNEYGDVTYVDGISEVNGYDTTSRAVVQNADGTYTTYPAYYVFNGSTGTNMRVDMSKLNNATSEGYTKASLIRVEVFPNSRLNWTFEDCTSLIDVYLPEGTFLHYASFVGCSALVSIKLPSTGVTQIPTDCFSGCTSLESVNIPNTVTSLGMRSFQNCNALSVIKFPESYTSIVPQDFRKITNGKASTPVTYIISKGCTGVNSNYSLDNCNLENLIFTGTADSAFVADLTTDASGWVSKITYANHCEYYFDNIHEEPDASCETADTCTRCGLETTTALKHVFASEILYENGFAAAGKLVKDCTNAGCTVADTETETAPIFTAKGYSNSENGIAGGYTVNIPAYNEYKDVTGKTITFGVMMLNPSYLDGKNSFFNGTDVNIDGAKGYVKTDMTNLSYKDFTYSIIGFAGDVKSLEIVICAYAYVDGEAVQFIQDQTTACASSKVTKNDATLYTVSFNSVEAKAGLVIGDLGEFVVPSKEN